MKNPLKILYLIIILFNSYVQFSQNEFSKWYFGQQAGLDFSTSPPTLLTNGVVSAGEGCASICDSGGNLLFYTDGVGVINSNHVLMANGTGLMGNQSTTQSAIIVKQPGNSNIFYIFTAAQAAASSGARYSIVDMSLAAGFGSVTVKNAVLYSPTCEKQVAVKHCNGNDVWILSHEYNSDKFIAYLLNSNGLSTTPVFSACGETITGAPGATIGHLKISPDGKKLAMATASNSIPTSFGSGGFQLFDFDAATGQVSNYTSLNNQIWAYGIEFSGDGTKLYGATSPFSSTVSAILFQWDICLSSNSAIIASQYSLNLGNILAGSLQRAIDNKIYMAVSGGQHSLNVINNPNAAGASMNFVFNGLSIAPKISGLGLPNYINPYIRPSPIPYTKTITCQTANFNVPALASFSSGCSTTPYAPSAYLWDFGEPGPGTANTSSLTNPSHTYANTGTYTVSLILFNNCTNDTLKQVVNITSLSPSPNVAGTFTICKGENPTYTVSGGTSYQWFNSSTSATLALAPTTNTVYSYTATANGCSLSKSFSVTVNPCLGIAGFAYAQPDIRFFPNPVNNELTLSSDIRGQLSIYDMSGRSILETRIEVGENKINTSFLKAGVYVLQVSESLLDSARSDPGVWRERLVKME